MEGLPTAPNFVDVPLTNRNNAKFKISQRGVRAGYSRKLAESVRISGLTNIQVNEVQAFVELALFGHGINQIMKPRVAILVKQGIAEVCGPKFVLSPLATLKLTNIIWFKLCTELSLENEVQDVVLEPDNLQRYQAKNLLGRNVVDMTPPLMTRVKENVLVGMSFGLWKRPLRHLPVV